MDSPNLDQERRRGPWSGTKVSCTRDKSTIEIARKLGGRAGNFTGEVCWARGYFVSPVGLDEEMVRAYIRHQEEEDERYDQMMKLSVCQPPMGGSRCYLPL